MESISKKYRECGHLTPLAINEIEEDTRVHSFRMVGGTVRVIQVGLERDRDSHQYYYRGREISYHEDYTYSKWCTGRYSSFETLTEAKQHIDHKIEKAWADEQAREYDEIEADRFACGGARCAGSHNTF
jgi:hypothetical protein